MDATNEIRLRLRFYKDVEENTDVILPKFENYKINCTEDCHLKIKHNHVWMNMPKSKREYWSPHLHLELEQKEHGGTHIRGLFGPDPTLWTLFMFLHFMVAGIFVIFSGIAYSNYMLKTPMTFDFVVMGLMVLVWLLLYIIAKQIRLKGNAQMNELEFKFLTILES